MRTGSKPPATTACAASPPPYSFRPLFREGTRHARGLHRAGRDGLPDGRATSRAKGHEVTVYNRTAREGRALGASSTAADGAATPARRRPRRRDRVRLRRQRRRPALGRAGRRRRPRRPGRRARSSSTTPPPRPTSRASCRGGRRARRATSSTRRSRAGRPGRRTARSRSCAAATPAPFARAEPVIARLRPGGDADGPGGRRPAHQDGQPDLHRRPGAGAGRGDQLRRSAPGSTPSRCSTYLQGRRPVLADGEPRHDDGRRTSSTSASRSTGCARTSASASTRRGATARRCRSRRSSTSSTPCSSAAAAAGTRRA